MSVSRLGQVVFVAVLVGIPLVAPQFWVTLGNYVGLYSIVALGLVLLTGVAGQTSFGQAAFVGIGAYTTAVLSTQYAMSPWINLVAGLVLTLALAFCLGLITLRMKGHYLPLATIAWGISLCSCSAISSSSAATRDSPAFPRSISSGSNCATSAISIS